MLAVCRRAKDELKNNVFKPYVNHMVGKKENKSRKNIHDHGELLQESIPALHLSLAKQPCEAPFGLGIKPQGKNPPKWSSPILCRYGNLDRNLSNPEFFQGMGL